MKLGMYLRQRCRIYFVAAEHELPLRRLFIAATPSTNSPKMSLFAINIFSVIWKANWRHVRIGGFDRAQVAARQGTLSVDWNCGLADCRKDSGLSPLDGGGASSRQILLIERLTDQRLDDRLSTDVQLLGSPVQFFQHARREVHIHPLDWTHHAPLVGEKP